MINLFLNFDQQIIYYNRFTAKSISSLNDKKEIINN